jgi:hypothetical protein
MDNLEPVGPFAPHALPFHGILLNGYFPPAVVIRAGIAVKK